MMRGGKILCALFLLSRAALWGAEPGVFEFIDQDIGEILYALSLYTGTSIAPDDTISGKATFRFAGTSFDQAFEAFMTQTRLFVSREEGVWTVSRVRITAKEAGPDSTDSATGGKLYHIEALDVLPARLLEKIAAACSIPVSWRILSAGTVSVHTGFLPAKEALEAAVGQFPGCAVRFESGRYLVESAKASAFSPPSGNGEQIDITLTVDETGAQTVSADIRRARFFDAADRLFTAAGREYSITVETGEVIPRIVFAGKPFDEAARLLASQAGLEVTTENGLCRFVPIRDKQRLLVNAGKTWQQFSLKHIAAADFLPLLTGRFGSLDTVNLAGGFDFLVLANETQGEEIARFIAENDRAPFLRLVTLRYLSAADFTANLPPGIRSSLIMKSGNANSFYYTGPEESYNRLLAALPEIDKPARQIRYDLLIIQFQETKDSTWKSGLSASNVAMGDRTGAAAQLGSVLSLNFDVVTAFGLTFAASLQSAVSENKASVFADTTLHGVSGEKISFRNTNTYRYRDNNLDPETGKPVYTGVTREIASGLTLDITGTVSGDGMITSKVTASVSRQGADVSKTTGNPPPTSEKSITTEVRSRSGDPVILSGLVQNDESATGERAPFLSKIPLIGNLFAAKTTATERTEMIIYLLPNAETELAPDKPAFETQAERSRRVYRTFILKEAL